MNFILNQQRKEKKKKIMTIQAIDVCMNKIHGHFFYRCFLPHTWMASQHRFLYCSGIFGHERKLIGHISGFLATVPNHLEKDPAFVPTGWRTLFIFKDNFLPGGIFHISSNRLGPRLLGTTIAPTVGTSWVSIKTPSCIKLQWNTKEWNVKKLDIWIIGYSKKHISQFSLYPH